MPFRRFLAFTLFAFTCTVLSAQTYTPERLSSEFPDSNAILKRVQDDFSKQWKEMARQQELRNLYRKRMERFTADFENDRFVNDPSLNAYFAGLMEMIAKGNSDWAVKEVRLFVARDPWPNASYVGYGFIVFNLGLLRRFENDAQVAFVLCHELAHYFFQHPEHAMSKYAEWVSSKETKKKIKEIDRMEYGARAEALRFVRGMTFGTRRHSRYSESQADSLGLVLLRNAGFAPVGAVRGLSILDECDAPKYARDFDPSILFPHPDFPFQQSEWLPERRGLSMSVEDEDEQWVDSLKTHPGCEERMARILEQLEGAAVADGNEQVAPEADFKDLVRCGDYNQVSTWWEMGNVGRCLLAAERLLAVYPEDLWLKATVGACFLKLYLAREAHTFGKYVERPSPDHKGAYKKWIRALNEMRMSDFAKAGYYFLQADFERGKKDERYWAACVRLAAVAGKEMGEGGYRAAFPGAYWLNRVERKLYP